MRTTAYLRVSTSQQDLSKNRSDVIDFARQRGFGAVEFIEETASSRESWKTRSIGDLIGSLSAGDVLIVPELSRIGRSMMEIMEVLNQCMQRKIRVYAIKGQWSLDDTLQSKVLAMAFSIAAEIERDLISARTKEALKARRAAGVRLGRPRGPGKSKLDRHLAEITHMLSLGSTQRFIAKRFDTTPTNLCRFLAMRGIDAEALRDAYTANNPDSSGFKTPFEGSGNGGTPTGK